MSELPSKTDSLAPGGRSRRSDALSVEVVPDDALLALMRGTRGARRTRRPRGAGCRLGRRLPPPMGGPVRRNAAGVGARRHLHAGRRAALSRLERLPRRHCSAWPRRMSSACASTTRPAWRRSARWSRKSGAMHAGSQASTREAEYRYPLGDRPWLRVKCTPVFEPGGTVRRRVHPAGAHRPRALRREFARRAAPGARVGGRDGVRGGPARPPARRQRDRPEVAGLRARRDQGADAVGDRRRARARRFRGGVRRAAHARRRTTASRAIARGMAPSSRSKRSIQRVEQAGREFILLLSRDISARKQAEEALSESAERFRALFDESPVAALLLDSGFRIDRRQSLGVRNTGRLSGRGPDRQGPRGRWCTPTTGRRTAACATRCSGRLHGADTAERRLVHRDGRLVWTKSSVRAVSAGNGHRHFLIVLENFTDRKIFEEQLQVALRDQQTLFETMSVGVAQTMSGQDPPRQSRVRRDVRLQRRRSDRHAAVGPVRGPRQPDAGRSLGHAGGAAVPDDQRRGRAVPARRRAGVVPGAGAAHPCRGAGRPRRCRRRSTRSRTRPRSSGSARRCRVRCWN